MISKLLDQNAGFGGGGKSCVLRVQILFSFCLFGFTNLITGLMYKECCGKCGMKAALPYSWMNWF